MFIGKWNPLEINTKLTYLFLFLVRNAGNLVPHSRLYGADTPTTEPAALELGCIVNNIKHIVVCGHSDCKVINIFGFKFTQTLIHFC